NADLQADVRDKRFRGDLYQRLAVVQLALPPLRDRGADLIQLAEGFVTRTCADYRLPRKRLAPDARARLVQHPWPGNVRELSNVIERAVLLSESDLVAAAHLELDPQGLAGSAPPVSAPSPDHHRFVLEQTGWNISRAAIQLGISRKTLRARIERF